MNNNIKVAADIVSKLKDKKFISEADNIIETKIANGTIKENDWKVFFEQQIRSLETSATIKENPDEVK